MSEQALLPVGRDCDCGHPLVWRAGKQWCAVYGSHPVHVVLRDRRALLAGVVDELAAMPLPTLPGENHKVGPRRRLQVVA